jgi:hypothetical protein
MTKHVPIIAAQRGGGYLVAGRWSFPTIRLALDAAENFARENPEARPEIMKALSELFQKLNTPEKDALTKMLNGQGTDTVEGHEYVHPDTGKTLSGETPPVLDESNWRSGPLNEPPPKPMSVDDIKSFLESKGIAKDDIQRMFPENGIPSGGGGRVEESLGMDAILRASNRVLPQRGDRFFSAPCYSEHPSAATLDGAATDQLERMFPGIGRIGQV